MKLNKRFLACFMAATMVMAPMAAYADSASTEISGTGSISLPKTEVYNVILPTSAGIAFNVDPYGILSIEDTKTLEDVVSNAAGTVTSHATAVINKSSVDINVKVSTYLTTSTPVLLVLTDSEENVKAGKGDLYLAIARYNAGVQISDVTTKAAADVTGDAAIYDKVYAISGASIDVSASSLNVASATAVTALTESGANTIDIALEDMASAYEVTSGGAVTLSEGAVTYNDANTYAFAITGYAKPDAQVWKDLKDAGANLVLNMKFDISSGSGSVTKLEYEATSGGIILKLVNGTIDTNEGVVITEPEEYVIASKYLTYNSDGTIKISSSAFYDGDNVITVKDTDGKTYNVTYTN